MPATQLDGDHVFVVAESAAYELEDAETDGLRVRGNAIHAWHVQSCTFDATEPHEIAEQCGGVEFQPADSTIVLDASQIQYAQVRHVRIGLIVLAVVGVMTLAGIGLIVVAAQSAHK
jgi:hypothetical protein